MNFLKKIFKEKSKIEKKSFSMMTGSGFSIIDDSNLFGCGSLRINLDDLFRMKKYNNDINKAIDIISGRVGINNFTIENEKSEAVEPKKYKAHYDYLEQLFTTQTWSFWKELFFTQTTIAGENYLLPEKNINGDILKFSTLDSRTMVKLMDNNGNITGFKQHSKLHKINEYSRDEIGYFIFKQDVENENLSMGLLDGLVFDLFNDFEGNKRNFYFFKNDAIPNALFVLDDTMSDEQTKAVRDQIQNKYSGSQNSHKFIASNAVKDVKFLNLTNKDMEFLSQRKFTIDKIASTFGVPKELLGYVENVGSYSKIIEIRRDFYEGTIKTYDKYLESVINLLLNKFADDLKLNFEGLTIKVNSSTSENKQLIEENQRKDIEMGIITINEVRGERGLPEYKEKWTKAPLIRNNLKTTPETPTVQTNNT